MRRRTAAVGLVLAAALVLGLLLLLREGGTERGAPSRTAAAGTATAPAAAAVPSEAEPDTATTAVPVRIPPIEGVEPGSVALHWVVGRPVDTRIYREGEYPAKRVWLVTHHRIVRPDAEGRFETPVARLPSGARTLLLADSETSVHGLRLLGDASPFERRAPVTGVLQEPDGGAWPDCWLSARRGDPPDWRTRVGRVADSFVTAAGPLDFDLAGKSIALTDDAGRFTLHLLPGRNTVSLGDWGDLGLFEVDVPPGGADLGEFRAPARPRRDGDHTLRGRVVDLEGRPLPDATVQLWDGNLGPHTHEDATDESGAFAFPGLRSDEAIVWVSSTTRPHLWVPEQSSGRVRLPSGPIVLRAPRPESYAWIRSDELDGHLLLFADRRWAGDVRVDGTERFGLPPGDYRLILVERGRILERDLSVREPGEIVLRADGFRDTTWE